MASATAPVTKPGNEKGRPVAGRPFGSLIINVKDDDSTTALRLQRPRLIGIIGRRADALASMVWGEAA